MTTKSPLKTIRTGNQTLIRKCADEIVALREMGESREDICDLLSRIFGLEKDLLTQNRLASALSKVLAGDSEKEVSLREARVNKLKGDMNLIIQNLRTKSALPYIDKEVVQKPMESFPPAARSAVSTVAQHLEKAHPSLSLFTQPSDEVRAEVSKVQKAVSPYLNTPGFEGNDRRFLNALFSDPEQLAKYRALEIQDRNAWRQNLLDEINQARSAVKQHQ